MMMTTTKMFLLPNVVSVATKGGQRRLYYWTVMMVTLSLLLSFFGCCDASLTAVDTAAAAAAAATPAESSAPGHSSAIWLSLSDDIRTDLHRLIDTVASTKFDEDGEEEYYDEYEDYYYDDDDGGEEEGEYDGHGEDEKRHFTKTKKRSFRATPRPAIDHDVDGLPLAHHGLPSFERLWEEYHLWDFMEAIGCPAVRSDGAEDPDAYQTIPTQHNTFDYMYQAFHQVVPPDDTTDDAHSFLGPHYTYPFPPDIPIRVETRPYVGRGLFATANITKGTVLWKPPNFAQFPSSQHYYQFLKVLWDNEVERHFGEESRATAVDDVDEDATCNSTSSPPAQTATKPSPSKPFVPHLVCNAILWSYTFRTGIIEDDLDVEVQDYNEYNNDEDKEKATATIKRTYTYQIGTDFDEGSLINSADTDDEINVVERMPDGTHIYGYFGDEMSVLMATKDIFEGEELRQNYLDSVDPDGWDYVKIWW